MKAYDETSITSSESMTDLKREVSRFKDAESHSGKYITDLEARLARSDESVLGLQRTTEHLEKECERRQDEVEMLKSRLEALRQDGESWRTDLEEREKRVKGLELKMLEWQRKKSDAGDARIRLGNVVGEVASARRTLEIDITNTPASTNGTPSPSSAVGPTPGPLASEISQGSDAPGENTQNAALESQLVALQQTHTATLADLSSVTAKYRDALREISDLAAQIQEAKLNNNTIPESPVDNSVEIPPLRRRMTGGRIREVSEPQQNSAGRRLFFRQAASAESLHARQVFVILSVLLD
jgi:chromosome segregation ATPase